MNDAYPKIIQIEPTTICNFHCPMCIRETWKEAKIHFPLDLFERMAKNNFPHADHIVLMGIGEVLTHPHFIEMIQLTEKYLPAHGTFEFTTNGALLTKKQADRILEASGKKLKRIIVSLESACLEKLKHSRPEASEALFEHIKYLATQRRQGKFEILAIESVFTKSNMHDLLDLIRFCANVPVDALYVTHLLPHSVDMMKEVAYSTISKESWEVSQHLMTESWKLIHDLLFVAWKRMEIQGNFNTVIQGIQKIQTDGNTQKIDLNPAGIWATLQKQEILQDVERIFGQAKQLAVDLHLTLDLPNIYPEVNNRVCPFVERDAALITVHGEVVLCFDFMHPSIAIVNDHERTENPVSFGNLHTQTLTEIWQSPRYTETRALRKKKKLNDLIPWCGDCPFSYANCFYGTSNDVDCYGNEPGCHECLYSADLVRCLF
ncbi:MAG: SPASM domain-containing protein [Promethearchaeota archaeon]